MIINAASGKREDKIALFRNLGIIVDRETFIVR
jgi:hypothetical protein